MTRCRALLSTSSRSRLGDAAICHHGVSFAVTLCCNIDRFLDIVKKRDVVLPLAKQAAARSMTEPNRHSCFFFGAHAHLSGVFFRPAGKNICPFLKPAQNILKWQENCTLTSDQQRSLALHLSVRKQDCEKLYTSIGWLRHGSFGRLSLTFRALVIKMDQSQA